VLVKKASVDPAFRKNLMERRAGAAREIELELTPAETALLDAVPEGQLAAIVDKTTVPDPQRRIFLGRAAATMLAAILGSCIEDGDDAEPTPIEVEKGIRPGDLTRYAATDEAATRDTPAPPTATPMGIRPGDLTESAGRVQTRAVERAQTRAAATRDAALAVTPKPADKSTD
jgi:hypothetical protein